MSPAVQQVFDAVKQLSGAEYEELREAMLEDEPLPDPKMLTGEAYAAEIRRRCAEIDAGTAVFSTWEEVKQRAWAACLRDTSG